MTFCVERMRQDLSSQMSDCSFLVALGPSVTHGRFLFLLFLHNEHHTLFLPNFFFMERKSVLSAFMVGEIPLRVEDDASGLVPLPRWKSLEVRDVSIP